jgi:autotransporter-associated beta strand protein
VECWGGGGAGGAGRKDNNTGSNTSQNAAGGGGGGYARRAAVPVTPGQTYTITSPAAAVSGANGTQTHNGGAVNGGTVTFVGDSSVTVQAAGGSGGPNSYVSGSNSTIGTTSGGTGGTMAASIGDPGGVFAGGNGFRGTLGAAGSPFGDNSSGGGGGGAGDASAGSSAVTGGDGAPGGIAGGGAGGNGRIGANTNAGAGSPGATPGGGGGGGKNIGQSTRLGGNGGVGQIVLTYTDPFPVVKANNTDDLNLGTSWVGGVVPVSQVIAEWDATVTSANTTSLGGNLSFGGLMIANPAGPVTINPGNTLTLGNALVDIDLSAATQNLTLHCNIATGGPNVWDIATGRTLTLGGIVSGPHTITIQGSGSTSMQGANSFTGGITISAGTLRLAAPEVIPHGAGTGNVTLNGTLDLNGFDEQINGLSGSGTVDNTAADTDSVFIIGANNQPGTFTGTLQNSGSAATLALTKNGTGALTLGGASSHAGLTTINGGAVTIQDGGALGTTAAGTVVNGTGTGNASNARLDLSGGITVAGEPLTISGVGNFFGALGSASGDNLWTGNVTIAPSGAGITRLGAAANATLTVSGVIDSGLVDTGLIIRTTNITNSTVILSAANTYVGDTWVAVGKLQLSGGSNRLPVGTRIRIGATTNTGEFDLNGTNQEIAGLSIEPIGFRKG